MDPWRIVVAVVVGALLIGGALVAALLGARRRRASDARIAALEGTVLTLRIAVGRLARGSDRPSPPPLQH